MSLVHNIVGGAGGGKPATTDAVLRVTAPSGSAVTIKKGTGASVTPNFYLDGTDTDTFFFYIKAENFGEYTATATLSGQTTSSSVTIEEAKEYILTLDYDIILYKKGMESGIVWNQTWKHDSSTLVANGTVTYEENDVKLTAQWGGGGPSAAFYYNSAFDVTNFNTIILTGSLSADSRDNMNNEMYVWRTLDSGYYQDALAKISILTLRTAGTVQLDVSNITGNVYFGVGLRQGYSTPTLTITDWRGVK